MCCGPNNSCDSKKCLISTSCPQGNPIPLNSSFRRLVVSLALPPPSIPRIWACHIILHSRLCSNRLNCISELRFFPLLNLRLSFHPLVFCFVSLLHIHGQLSYFTTGLTNILYNFKHVLLDIILLTCLQLTAFIFQISGYLCLLDSVPLHKR